MQVKTPETDKKLGVCYAVTDDGLELPVVDITNPAFAFATDPADVNTKIEEFVRSMHALEANPALMQGAAAQSLLIRGMLDSANGITGGMVTYMHKLGPENLGASWATPVDRQWAGGLTPLTFRWRMRDVARLLADGLVSPLEDRPDESLMLINIGGGPAADSWNALILLNREHPELLADRAIEVFVLDVDAAGPHFGARALAVLRGPDGPLVGLDVTLQHIPYDWAKPPALEELLQDLDLKEQVAAASSEGGLFEYASDAEIVANLRALQEGLPRGAVVVGPVVRDASTLDPRLAPSEHAPLRPAIRYMGLAAFGELATQAGWRIDRTLDGPMHQIVSLRRLHRKVE